mmetsp:Transcript_11992/g.33185  ORF Transcript_11992/g.33185 Transcript_11992/m.33185 type:complete len:327 (+) Transcript_11992:85-1065(+)
MTTTKKKNETLTTNTEQLPFVLRCWHTLATSLPVLHLPFLKKSSDGRPLNISVSLVSALYLATVNWMAGHTLVALGFPPDTSLTLETTAAVTAEFHSNTLLLGLAYLFITATRYQPSAKMNAPYNPQPWQDCCDAVISFCIGYMMYDFGFILVKAYATNGGELTSDDTTFMAHHVMTTVYMMQTRVYGAGHFSAMICMFWGEFTNPFHNGYYIFKNILSLDIYQSSQLLSTLQYVNNGLFAITYVPIRAAIGPVYFAHVSYDLVANGTSNGIPVWVIGLWLVLIWGVVYGSVPWIQIAWSWLADDYWPVLVSLWNGAGAGAGGEEL